MILGTTPTHTFSLPFGVENVAKVRILYAQRNKVVLIKTKEDCTVEGNAIHVRLTQKETLSFEAGAYVNIQLRILTTSGDALASQIMRVSPEPLLDNEVI